MKMEMETESRKEFSTREVIFGLLKSASNAERREARMKFHLNSARLGYTRRVSVGTMTSEVWDDGQLLLDFNLQLKKVQQMEAAIVEQQNLKKQQAGKSEVDRGAAVQKEDFFYPDEYYRAHLAGIKWEEEMIMHQQSRYQWEKERLMSEMKRISAENGSRFNDFPILSNRYALLNLLGKEKCGEVYMAFDLVEHRYVACKLHMLNVLWEEEHKRGYLRHAIRGYNIHKTLVHRNIVRLWDIFEIDQNTFCTVLDYCSGKDIYSMLSPGQSIPEEDARTIIVQIFRALVSQKKAHCNLKPGNVLFDELGDAKITDFALGLVGPYGMELMRRVNGNTDLTFLPPEMFSRPLLMLSKVDVWSCGILLYVMLFGNHPFLCNQTIEQYKQNFATQKVEFPSRPAISDQAKDFIWHCLTRDQAKRPNVLTMSKHPYLTFRNDNINLDLVLSL